MKETNLKIIKNTIFYCCFFFKIFVILKNIYNPSEGLKKKTKKNNKQLCFIPSKYLLFNE